MTDGDLGGGRQAQSLEELLDGAEARGGRALHWVLPAVGLVPVLHPAGLEDLGRLLGVGLGLLGDLPRRTRPRQRAGAWERLDRHVTADADRDWGAAVGVDDQLALLRLVAGPQLGSADV